MLIPKNRVRVIYDILKKELDKGSLTPKDHELVAQACDRAALAMQGDANYLEIEVSYKI